MCALAPFLGPFGLWCEFTLLGPFGLWAERWLGGGDGVPGWSVVTSVLGSPAAGGDDMEQLVDDSGEGSLGKVSRWGASAVVGDEMDAAGRGSLWFRGSL